MTKDKAKEILKRHNEWRRSEEIGVPFPDTAKEIGEAIDVFVYGDCNITIDDLELVSGLCTDCFFHNEDIDCVVVMDDFSINENLLNNKLGDCAYQCESMCYKLKTKK